MNLFNKTYINQLHCKNDYANDIDNPSIKLILFNFLTGQ